MARGKGARDLKKEADWRRHMKAQVGSGLSVGAYCRRHGLPMHGFYWWRREVGRRESGLRDGEKRRSVMVEAMQLTEMVRAIVGAA